MLEPSLKAFLVDFFATCVTQFGFILWKLAHNRREKKIWVKYEGLASNNDDTISQMSLSAVSQDQGSQLHQGNDTLFRRVKITKSTAYCSFSWMFGSLLLLGGNIVHAMALSIADMTLLAGNATTAIIMTQILSMCILGEKFFCIYDFPALLFMSIGCIMIVVNGNVSETVKRDKYETLQILIQPLSLIFIIVMVGITVCAFLALRNLLQ